MVNEHNASGVSTPPSTSHRPPTPSAQLTAGNGSGGMDSAENSVSDGGQEAVGTAVGTAELMGAAVGAAVGTAVGRAVGVPVGARLGTVMGMAVGVAVGEAAGESEGATLCLWHVSAPRPATNALPPRSVGSTPQTGLKAYPSLWYSLTLDPSHVFKFAGAFDVLSPFGSFVSTMMENS